jgi:hypothetical protein
MDDDDVQETGIMGDNGTKPSAPAGADPVTTEAPPPKPPRPVSEQQRNEQVLKEAFPTIDVAASRPS